MANIRAKTPSRSPYPSDAIYNFDHLLDGISDINDRYMFNTMLKLRQLDHERACHDPSIRDAYLPSSISLFIGQSHIKDALATPVLTAQTDNSPLCHILLCGQQGQGKRSLARAIAGDNNYIIYMCSGREGIEFIPSALSHSKPYSYIILCNIHLLSKSHLVILGNRLKKKSDEEQNRIPPLTLICTALDVSQVGDSARIIFDRIYKFSKYNTDELSRIIMLYSLEMNTLISYTDATLISAKSNGSVSEALRIYRLVREHARAVKHTIIDRADIIGTLVHHDTPDKQNANQKVVYKNVDDMTGIEFENTCMSLFERLGYTVVRTKQSNDQGADLLITKDGILTAVQTKRYSSSIGNSAVQEVIAGRLFYKAQKAMVVTNSHFTPAARELALSADVILWDRDTLRSMIALAYENI